MWFSAASAVIDSSAIYHLWNDELSECSTTVLLSWPAAVVHFVLSIEIPTKPMRVFTKCIKNDFFCYFSSLHIVRKLVFIKLSLKELS